MALTEMDQFLSGLRPRRVRGWGRSKPSLTQNGYGFDLAGGQPVRCYVVIDHRKYTRDLRATDTVETLEAEFMKLVGA